MQSRIEEIRDLDAEVLAISSDTVEQCDKLARKQRFDIRLLSDPDAELINRFGLQHANANPMNSQDISRPATFVLDRNGQIAWKILPENWRVRVRPETLIEQLQQID